MNDQEIATLPATVYQRNGRTFAVIPELFAIAEGSNADEAVARVKSDLQMRTRLFSDAGAPIPSGNEDPVRRFFVKTAAVVLAFVVVMVTADIVAQRTFAELPRRIASLGFSTIDELGQLSQWVSEDRKRQVGKSVRVLLENLEPLIDEIRPTLSGAQETGRMNGEPGQ